MSAGHSPGRSIHAFETILTGPNHTFSSGIKMAVELQKNQIEVDDAQAPRRTSGVTLRALIIGFAAIIPGVFWGVYGDVISQTDLTSTSLMMPPIIILMALIIVNSLVRRIKPAWALAKAELITIYAMLTVSVILSGMGMLQFLCTTLGAVPHYATPDNGWQGYLNYVPHWIMPKLWAIDGFYKGGKPIPWNAWKWPIIYWSGFLFTMLFTMMCINTIVLKQWMERERLSFPIVQLPLEMTDEAGGFFRNKVMWAGFTVAALLESMNSLNYLYPNVPYIHLTAFDLQPLFTQPPWKSIGYFPTTFYPLAIGLGFVLSADVSFSLWFFYLLTKAENVFAASVGWVSASTVSSPPYIYQQGVGAFIGIAAVAVYLSRNHLKDVFNKTFSRSSKVDDSDQPLGYGTAVMGAALGFVAMIVFCRAVGMSSLVAAVYLGIYIIFATTITRLRAEAGPAWVMGPYQSALDTLVQPIGSRMFSRQNLVALAYFHWFSIEMRCCPMAVQMESMKMAQSVRIKQRALAIVLLAAIVLGIAVGFWACLAVWYKYGAGSARVDAWRTSMGKSPFDIATNYSKSQTAADFPGTLAMIFGALVVVALSALRTRFIWFPFHPAGYVLGNTGTMYWLWCPFMIAWFCKVIITRYAGIKGYRAALPFFLGLVLGDYMTSGIWALAGSMLGIRMYRCFPC